MSLTRDERLRRQEFDDGDADDTVWFRTGRNGAAYHETQNCHAITDTRTDAPLDDVTRAAAQRRWLAPCTSCVLDGDRPRKEGEQPYGGPDG